MTTTKIIGSTEAAKLLRKPVRSVQRAAERAKIGTRIFGRLAFSEADIPRLKAAIHKKSGRPKYKVS